MIDGEPEPTRFGTLKGKILKIERVTYRLVLALLFTGAVSFAVYLLIGSKPNNTFLTNGVTPAQAKAAMTKTFSETEKMPTVIYANNSFCNLYPDQATFSPVHNPPTKTQYFASGLIKEIEGACTTSRGSISQVAASQVAAKVDKVKYASVQGNRGSIIGVVTELSTVHATNGSAPLQEILQVSDTFHYVGRQWIVDSRIAIPVSTR